MNHKNISTGSAAQEHQRAREQLNEEEQRRIEGQREDERHRQENADRNHLQDQEREVDLQKSRARIKDDSNTKMEDQKRDDDIKRLDQQRHEDLRHDDSRRADMRRDEIRREDDRRRDDMKRTQLPSNHNQLQGDAAPVQQTGVVEHKQGEPAETPKVNDRQIREQVGNGSTQGVMTNQKNVLDPNDLVEHDRPSGVRGPRELTAAELDKERAHIAQGIENRAVSSQSVTERNRARTQANEEAGKSKPPANSQEHGQRCEAGVQQVQELRAQREQEMDKLRSREKELAQ